MKLKNAPRDARGRVLAPLVAVGVLAEANANTALIHF